MTDSPEELSAVEQLLTESDALRAWLARLDLAPTDAPVAVRARVRADYQRRLDQVTGALQEHSEVLAAKLADDRAEHDHLHGLATSSHEALAEAELRFAVGEYDDSRISDERTRHHGDIETYELGLAAVSERIARLEQVYAMASHAEPAPQPLAEPAMAAPAAPVGDIAPTPEPVPVHEPTPEPVASDPVEIGTLAPDGDTDAFLSVFAEPTVHVIVEEPAPRVPSAPAPEVGPLSFRPAALDGSRPPAAAPARPRPFDGTPPLGLPSDDQHPRFVRPGERMRAPATPPASPTSPPTPEPARAATTPAHTAASDPQTPSSAEVHEAAAAVQVGRTLRCGECGAMNRPLEWYCEKCGAELTTL